MVNAIDSEWLTVSEACAYLHISRRTLYRWRDRGLIVLHRFGPRQLRVRREDVSAAGPLCPTAAVGTGSRVDDLLTAAETEAEGGAAALSTYWEEWGRRADALRDAQRTQSDSPGDSVSVIRAARRQAEWRVERRPR